MGQGFAQIFALLNNCLSDLLAHYDMRPPRRESLQVFGSQIAKLLHSVVGGRHWLTMQGSQLNVCGGSAPLIIIGQSRNQ